MFTFTLSFSVQLSWLIAHLIVPKEGSTHWKRKMLWENCVKSISWNMMKNWRWASFKRISHPFCWIRPPLIGFQKYSHPTVIYTPSCIKHPRAVLSSPKWILSILLTNWSQIFSKSSFNCFSISYLYFD